MKKVAIGLVFLLSGCGELIENHQGYGVTQGKLEGGSYSGIEVDFLNCKATQGGFHWPATEVIKCTSVELTHMTETDGCKTFESFRKVGASQISYSFIRSGCENLFMRFPFMSTGGAYVMDAF